LIWEGVVRRGNDKREEARDTRFQEKSATVMLWV
jgi:hypothetical protein